MDEAKPEVYITSCSGFANVGKASFQVSIELAKAGVGNLFCLTEITAGVEEIIKRVKSGKIIVIDGCQNKCGLLTLQKAGYYPYVWVNALLDCGMVKTGVKDDPSPEELDKIYKKVLMECQKANASSSGEEVKCCCP